MKMVEIDVYCAYNQRILTVYCYELPNGKYFSNGCEELNGSHPCNLCREQCEKLLNG